MTDRVATVLSSLIIVGLVVSYLPQHLRIILNKSSEGLSPYFLLLGSIGSTCSFFNILSLQWDQVASCRYESPGVCLANTLGIVQVFFQFVCFNIIFLLFLMYYPLHKRRTADNKRTADYEIAFTTFSASVGFIALTLSATTVALTLTDAVVWANLLGVISTLLACVQYIPQIMLTARTKLVGSLSIPMMCMQSPGGFLFAYTLAIRPGVNFSGWAVYFITALLQSFLLCLCVLFKLRQNALGIDDYGVSVSDVADIEDETSPLLAT